MSNGKVVLTSKDPVIVDKAKKLVQAEYDCGVIGKCEIKEDKDIITWRFHYEDDAISHTRIFINAGFEYVKRIV